MDTMIVAAGVIFALIALMVVVTSRVNDDEEGR